MKTRQPKIDRRILDRLLAANVRKVKIRGQVYFQLGALAFATRRLVRRFAEHLLTFAPDLEICEEASVDPSEAEAWRRRFARNAKGYEALAREM